MALLVPIPAAGQRPLPPWPGEQVQIGEHRLFVRRSGTPGGEPAVFVHGLGGAATNWTDLMGLLAGVVDGYAPDLPGFGLSPPPASGSYAIGTHVAAVTALVEDVAKAAGTPVHLWGNSLGGVVAVRLAAARPDLVRTLSLVSPALPYAFNRRLDWRLPLSAVPGLGDVGRRLLARQPVDAQLDGLLAMVARHPERIHPDRLAQAREEFLERGRQPHAEAALRGSFRGLLRSWVDVGDGSLWAAAASLRSLPVLVVHGREDRLVPIGVTRRLRRILPLAHVLELDDVGHVAMVEEPGTVARAWLTMRESRAAG